ncbi:MAG: transcriptional regulator [Micromonosporaceae bacterium]|nr:transcriptional regulator [Micromonosporaceae bacterium]
MSPSRTYGDPCAVARALDVVGDRWALVIVRELLFGPKRYGDLQAGLPNASPTVLAQRLRDLEGSGVVERRNLGHPARVWVYQLTAWGQELQPVILDLARWGRHAPAAQGGTVSADSLVLALHTHLNPDRLGDLDATFSIDLGEDVFAVRVANGEVTIRRGRPATSTAAITTDFATFRALVIEGRPAKDLGDSLERTGDRKALQRLLGALDGH